MEVDAEIACEIMRNIGQLWLDGQFVDLQINVGDSVFDCNRLILCACSKFFKVLLKSEVKGEVEHSIKHLTIRGISPEIFQLVLNALFKGEVGLNAENMVEFWHAVCQLQIPVLVSKCETFVSGHLTPENLVNIHRNALSLKSVDVTTAVQQFVADNFETFKELDILLQQPASFIESVIGGDSIAGQSQDRVVEFILKWVNYEFCARDKKHVCADSAVEDLSTQTHEVTRDKEPVCADSAVEDLSTQTNEVTRDTEPMCADSAVEDLSTQTNEVTRDTEPVCADSAVEDLSTQTNEVTRKTIGTVDVIFEKPHVDSGDDCFRHPTGQPSVRKQSLGKLLKLVRFNEVSKDVWEALADDDLVMGTKETRDIVRQAAELVNSASTASLDTENTVVFVTGVNTETIYAYSLDRGDIFKFYSTYNKIVNIHTHNTKLLWCTLYHSNHVDPFQTHIAEFPFSEISPVTVRVRNDFVIVEDFCYTSRESMCRTHIKDGGWYELSALPDHMPKPPSLAVFKDNILYYNSTLEWGGEQEVYCLDTKSRKSRLVMTCDYEDCDFVTFIHEDQFYIVYGNGVFVNATQFVTSPVEAFSLSKYSGISKSRLLWEFQFKMYGAVVHHDNLIVFGDLSSISISEIPECKIPGLKAIKFVHLYGLITKCHPLIIPKQLLTTRI